MTLQAIRNFLPLNEKLLSSGMPTAEQLSEIAAEGVQVVINLAPYDPAEDLADEGKLAQSLGMKYINIPVEWEAPARQDLEAFIRAMDQNRENKLLVHCRANYRATGFIALYRIVRLGWRPEEAFGDLRRIWNPDEYPAWKKFLEENSVEQNPPRQG